MYMINFNIKVSNSLTFKGFISLLKEVALSYSSKQLSFEYTLEEKLLDNTFTNYSDFESFYNTKMRFDLLKLEKGNHFIGFQNSQGDLRVFGKSENNSIAHYIIELLGANIVYGYIHDDFDLTLSRAEDYGFWKIKLKEIPTYVQKVNNPQSISERDKYLIDLESLPTHYHRIKTGDKLWFGACAEMYFSELYYKYIPKIEWEKFTDCEENTVLENGLRKIVLYNDFSDFENIENRNKQWAFRNQLGMDKVAHKLIPDGSSPTIVKKELEGLYKIINPQSSKEKHGGMTVVHTIYWYLAFYKKNHTVGFYGNSKDDYDRFISERFEMKGNYSIDNNQIAFKIRNPYTNESIDFKGIISEDLQKIDIQAAKESENEKKWIDDTFVKIEIDHIA